MTEFSPCVDAGIDSLTITDAYGAIITVVDMDSADYYADAPDMGCYEYEVVNKADYATGINQFVIYPNPASEIINIDISNKIIQQISITDLTGRTVFEKHEFEKNNFIDISKLKSGIYLITIKTNNELFTTKILKK